MVITCDDLLPDILSHLPIKSLFRFKCVSQRFNKIISDPKLLAKNHQIHALKSVHGFFHFSYSRPQNIRYLSLHPQHHPVNNSGRPIYSYQILDSCSGLLLLNLVNDFSLYNPTIKKHRYILKPINWSPSPKQNIGLAYDSSASISNNICKLVFVYKSVKRYGVPGVEEYEFKIFSPNANAWRVVDMALECISGEFVKQGQAVYFNESLHWIRESGDIIVFDMKENVPRFIRKPIFLEEFKDNMWFGVTNGSLGILYISMTQVVIFVLHDYLENSWGHLIIEINSWPQKKAFSPIFFDKDLIVLQSQGEVKEIHLYNMRLKEWKKIGVILDSEDGVHEYIPFIPCLAWLDSAPLNNNYLEENYSNCRFEHFWPMNLSTRKRTRVISQVPPDSR
ncbi:putative F-box/kelch-repeat protein At1g20790 [Quercus suber]|uniref:F-box/kelch-repeat protein n=1 Tax=Quercus suber TaxID=58331 RepID=A0AAW0KX58_QUESU|nr:putative F-box/kelch-repeat protein At1g20790 [Quercus suber]